MRFQMHAYVVQAEGEFGDFAGPKFFNKQANAEAWAAAANAALLPHVPQFKVYCLKAVDA